MRRGSRSAAPAAEALGRASSTGSAAPDAARGRPRSSLLGRASLFLLIATAVLAPFQFGSTEPVWLAVWAVLLGASLATTDLRAVEGRHVLTALPALLLFGAYALLGLCQQTAVLGRPHPIWSEAASILGEPLPAVLAVARSEWPVALGPSLVFVMAFLGGLFQGADRGRASLLMRSVAVAGIVYAALGLASLLAAPDALLWRPKSQHFGSLTATFVSRNTAASFFGACAVVWFARAFAELDRLALGRMSGRDIAALLSERPPRCLILSLGGGFACTAATFMTASRAGTALTLGAIGLTALLSLRRGLSGAKAWAIAATCAVLAGFLLFELWGGGLAARIQRVDSEAARFATYRSALGLIAEHPWWGTGLGTFEQVFPKVRSAEVGVWSVWDRAHNTPLEIAVEMGLPFAAACILVWLGYGVLLLRGALRRRRNAVFPITGLAVGLLGALHSLLEFSVQIPGFALPFAAVLGAATAQALPTSPRYRSGPTQALVAVGVGKSRNQDAYS